MYVNFAKLAKAALELLAKIHSYVPKCRESLFERKEGQNLRSTNDEKKTGPNFLLSG